MIYLVELKNIYKTYNKNGTKVEALKGVSLKVSKGDIYGVIGLSGAGKSSLVRCINLLEVPDSGEVIVNGIHMTKIGKLELRDARKQIGIIFQHFNLLTNSTVYENIAFPLKLEKKANDYIEKRVNEVLNLVGLSDKKHAYPSMLSGGQKQRVGIARALVGGANVLICDEATSVLDPTTTKSILQLLKKINKEFNITIIIITHEMEVIKQICNKVSIIEYGKIIEYGDVIDIATSPKTKTGMEFFNFIDIDIVSIALNKRAKTEGTIIKAMFMDRLVEEYLISNMITKFNVQVSILLGNIEEINNVVIGNVVMVLNGKSKNIIDSINYLKSQGVEVEVIKL